VTIERRGSEDFMKIKVWTKQPNHFVGEASRLLMSRGHSQAEADSLLVFQFDGEIVTFQRLSVAQFCAVEDTAVRMGLPYDGSQ
jgi:hypothetical protein